MFPVKPTQGTKANLLISSPYRNWKDAKTDLHKHAVLEYHKQSMALMSGFLSTMENPETRIEVNLSNRNKELVEKNRTFLISIIKCIEFCGRRGIALRGHRDDDKTKTTEENANKGNFKALVNFRVDAGDTALKDHLETCAKNASYISKGPQNQLLDCMKDYMQSVIVGEIRKQDIGPLYGLMADEVTDVENWEQLGIVIRYLQNGKPTEKLVTFVDCKEISGRAICQHIAEALQEMGLAPADCRFQTYDGAGNMAGKTNGCAALFQKQYAPKAPYIHCANHELNLALSKGSNVPEINSMLAAIQKLAIFFKYSPKRQRQFEDTIEAVETREKTKFRVRKVQIFCETRWVAKHETIAEIHELYEVLLICLDGIATKSDGKVWDSKTVTEAHGLLDRITSPSFIAAFHCVKFLFGYTEALSTLLQGSEMDVIVAFEEIDLVKKTSAIRANADKEFSCVFLEMTQKAKTAGAGEMNVPRICKRQTQRSNVPCPDPESYWRNAIFVPYLDRVMMSIEERFSELSKQAMKVMYLLPVILGKGDVDPLELVNEMISTYDMPAPGSLPQEYKRWQLEWSGKQVKPSTIRETLGEMNSKRFPNIYTILATSLLMPCTSAGVERSNSALKLIKTKLRSTMGEDRLNTALLLFVHKKIPLDYDKIVDLFATKYPHRMLFVNPLKED